MKPEDTGTAVTTPGNMADASNIIAMMGPYFAVFAIIGILIFIFFIFCWWRIFSKAGYSGALSLIFLAGLIPFIGGLICLGVFIWFAFAQWPALKGGGQAPMKT
jgi:hypothetical protein